MTEALTFPQENYIHREENGIMLTYCTMRQQVLHAIGMDYKKPYTRHGKKFYRPYRNFFCTYITDATWSKLAKYGYADHDSVSKDGLTNYYLTREGLDWLGNSIGVTIRNERN